MSDDALKLVATEQLDGAAGDADDRVLRLSPRRESVDALFLQKVDRRHGDTGGDRHLLDDVQNAPLARVARIGVDGTPTEHLRDTVAAIGQAPHLVEASHEHDEKGAAGEEDQAVEIEPVERELFPLSCARRRIEERRTRCEMHAQDDRDHREHKVEDEYVAVLPGVVLMLKEVHSHSRTGPWAPRAAPRLRSRKAPPP